MSCSGGFSRLSRPSPSNPRQVRPDLILIQVFSTSYLDRNFQYTNKGQSLETVADLINLGRGQAGHVMNRSLRMMMVSGIISAASWQSFAEDVVCQAASAGQLCIHLYNLADVSPQTLEGAEEVAARILATAGVDIVWQKGPADSREARDLDLAAHHRGVDTRSYLVLRIVRGVSIYPTALGYALPDAQTGVHATVFYDRIERLTEPSVISIPKMLGHAMAHEIGHVLLGSMEHSHSGIMKAHWGKADYQRAQTGYMEFSDAHRRVMRDHASMRLAKLSSTDSGVAASVTTALGAKVTVWLYDYAAVPYKTLAEAEHEAFRIFRKAGVNILWMQCGPPQNNPTDLDACEQAGQSPWFVVKVLPEAMAVHLRRQPQVFGMAIQLDAFIFFDRVQEFCAVEGFSLSLILGHAIAHELGHMVLGQREHSASGIMMETIRKDALKQAEKGDLLFTRQQAAEMRARLCSQTQAKKQ
jgi:hypothetical protein